MKKKITTKKQWQQWAIKLQGLAQAGLYYTNNQFERERYREIQQIACEILKEHSSIDIDVISQYFTDDSGYKTPKIDSRSVCIHEGKILMVQESSGLWSIPGGWMDIDQTLSQNCIKEAKEEAGADVIPKFVICLHDWKTHVDTKHKSLPFQIVKIFVMCDYCGMSFKPNSETIQSGFFDRNNLPEMAIGKNNYEQVKLCFDAYDAKCAGKHWETIFD